MSRENTLTTGAIPRDNNNLNRQVQAIHLVKSNESDHWKHTKKIISPLSIVMHIVHNAPKTF